MTPEALRSTDIESGELTYPGPDGLPIEAYLARPNRADRHPAVIVLHARNGLLPFFKECADDLAWDGFVGFAVGWQTRLPPNEERRLPPNSVVVEDIASAVDYLGTQPFVDPGRLGIMGFCHGGTLVFHALSLVPRFKGGVAHYGSPKHYREAASPGDAEHEEPQPYDLADSLTGALLMIAGEQDTAVPLEDVYGYRDRLQQLGKGVAVEVYPGVGHAFTIRGGRSYAEEPARDAWGKTIAHFKRTLA